MPRTTLNIDGPILRDLKRMQRRQKKPLGRLVSELLARSLAAEREPGPSHGSFRWTSRPMGTRVDLTDKEAVRAALESEAEGQTVEERLR